MTISEKYLTTICIEAITSTLARVGYYTDFTQAVAQVVGHAIPWLRVLHQICTAALYFGALAAHSVD
jgi:hypothetical protein